MPKEQFKRHAGDCNDIARQRQDSKSQPYSKQGLKNYEGINWNSKKDK